MDVLGHPTYVSDQGHGDLVLLLHGGLGACVDFGAQIPALADSFRVVGFDRRGHGRTADTESPFSYESMAEEAAAVLANLGAGPVHVIGWSDGANVAMVLALTRPELVRTAVLVGGNYRADGMLPGLFEPDDPAFVLLAGLYERRSPDGPDHWPVILDKTLTLWRTEPNLTVDDLARMTCPTLVLVGDDEPISLAHTCSLYEALPAGQLAVVPGASHLVLVEKPELVNQLILEFLRADGPPATLMPARRRHR